MFGIGVVVLVLSACGGGDDGPGSDRATWMERNGPAVRSLRLDMDAAHSALSAGDRTVILAACNGLTSTAERVESDALPVPDDEVDERLRTAVSDASEAAELCVTAARDTSAALVEGAMARMDEARLSLTAFEEALESWR